MMKPVDIPAKDPMRLGMARRKPELEADVSNTAWKNNGALNNTVLEAIAPRRFAKTIFEIGALESSLSGIRGCVARVSMYRKADVTTTNKTKHAMTTGDDHGKMFPPRFRKRMRR